MSILVLGLGNLLMTDDAVGPRAVAAISDRFLLPPSVAVIDGGTLGLDLLPLLEGVEKLLIIDALEMDGAPGAVFRLQGPEVPRALAGKVSVHQMGVPDLLSMAELQGHLPPELVVWGVQPASIELGTDLTPPVAEALDAVVNGVVEELAGWGFPAVAR